MTGASDTTQSTVNTDVPSKPSFYEVRPKSAKIGGQPATGRGMGGGAGQIASGRVGSGPRSRAVAPLQLDGERPVAKAFASTPTKVIKIPYIGTSCML